MSCGEALDEELEGGEGSTRDGHSRKQEPGGDGACRGCSQAETGSAAQRASPSLSSHASSPSSHLLPNGAPWQAPAKAVPRFRAAQQQERAE